MHISTARDMFKNTRQSPVSVYDRLKGYDFRLPELFRLTSLRFKAAANRGNVENIGSESLPDTTAEEKE